MSRSGGMSQMLKGIIIGVVLIMAIIGTMSMLNKDDPLTTAPTTSQNTQSSEDISAPAITLNPNKTQNNNSTDKSNIGDLNAEIPEDKTLLETTESSTASEEVKAAAEDNTNKPVLEGEKTAEERSQELNPIAYGMMELKAINPSDNKALKANYVVFNANNEKVAESANAIDVAYKLAVGQYKVETTLTRADEVTQEVIPVVSKSRYMIIRENTRTKHTFELEPPDPTGVLQVSAKLNDQIIRASFVVQNATGEIIASRNNVTNSLFKLDKGIYKVSVSNGNNKDFRSVEIKAGESLQTVFILKEEQQQGKLLVRVFDIKSDTPIRADISISRSDGTVIQDLKDSTTTELTLAAGDYNIRVIGPNGTSNKNIRVNSGQVFNEIFRFEAPKTDADLQNTVEGNQENDGTKVTENVTIKPVETETDIDSANNAENNTVSLRIVALDEKSRKPIKSNIYIQNPAGKHLDKRTYVDAANFDLSPGVYKVTVRANNRKNIVKTIRLTENQNINETFLLINPNQQNNQQVVNSAVKTPAVTSNTAAIPTGFLNVSMQPPKGLKVNPNSLRSHFIVTTTTGRKIVELTSVSSGNFKLDAGAYNVTAIHQNQRKSQRVNVKPNKNTRLMFYTNDFQNQVVQVVKGVLRSRIVDDAGRPLKGNLIVSNMAGQIVARANGVSNAVFDLPPTRHTISVNYQGLSGNEVVNIVARETTIQTFTIAQNRNAPQNNNSQNNNSRDIKKILRDKLKEEIRRTF